MKNKVLTVVGSSILAIALLSGCAGSATSTSAKASSTTTKATKTTAKTSSKTKANSKTATNKTSSKGTTTASAGSNQYQGKANLTMYTTLAKKQPKSFQAQIDAGMSEYQNKNYNQAITYYKNAAAINSKSAIPYDNIGNVYKETKDLKNAISNYTKATQIDPSYASGWLDLTLAEVSNGNTAGAKTSIQKALKDVKSSDKLYNTLKSEQKSLDQKK